MPSTSNYKELLTSPEWKAMRNRIVNRDGYKCQLCQNEECLSSLSVSLASNIFNLNSNQDYWGYGLFHESKPPRTYLKRSYLSNSCSVLPPHMLVIYWERGESQFSNAVAARTLNDVERDSFINRKNDFISPIRDDTALHNWIYNLTLHVHHEFYRFDKKPWEYPEALKTLCWKCHENAHPDKKVRVVNSQGDDQYFTPCLRCYGAGIFPEYSHVQHGICFRCDGARFEEISPKLM